jgi:murein DD-endopeptidase MepM/ murein hydrolase activator NlpD
MNVMSCILSPTRFRVVVFSFLAAASAILLWGPFSLAEAQEPEQSLSHIIAPGDTWLALKWRFALDDETIKSLKTNSIVQTEPVIGSIISIPVESSAVENTGMLKRTDAVGLIGLGVLHGASPWELAILNDIDSIYSPLLYRPIFFPGEGSFPRELPAGFRTLNLSDIPAYPGKALAYRAELNGPSEVSALLAGVSFRTQEHDGVLVGLAGTGAFFPSGDYDLSFSVEGHPLWVQPLRIVPGEWTYEQITLTGSAAAIDQESIRQERARLSEIWSDENPGINWLDSFRFPIDSYLEISSLYGAHRSYNGGPYNSYHEGVDFAAYGGTPVFAPAHGIIALAEFLYVRGGAVIIDHGNSVFTGLYNMSEILVQPGDEVEPGQLIGRVGTTGLSTGNHLHWDFLVGGMQVDALSWLDLNLPCWLAAESGTPCESIE